MLWPLGDIRSKSAYENDNGGQKRNSSDPPACSVDTAAGVVVFRSTRSQGARLNTASDTRLQHSRRPKLTNPIELFCCWDVVQDLQNLHFYRYRENSVLSVHVGGPRRVDQTLGRVPNEEITRDDCPKRHATPAGWQFELRGRVGFLQLRLST